MLVEGELRLLGVDHKRAAGVARSLQLGGRGTGRHQRSAPWFGCLLVPREDAIDLLVVQAHVGANQRAAEACGDDLRAPQQHLDSHRQTLHSRHERAGVAGERMREHRLDRAGHVDACRAPARLKVDRRAQRHVCGDVGDMDPNAHSSVGQSLGGDRVVEVARRGWVDCEGRQLAQVATLAFSQLYFALAHARAPALRASRSTAASKRRMAGLAQHLLDGVASGFGALLRRPHDARVRGTRRRWCGGFAA